MIVRGVVGGVMMGLANLVPGISGGTMLVATGVYTRFINAIAEVSTFKFRLGSLVTLACVVGSAVAAIVLLAGPVKDLVIDQRWIMYSLFIGLTLGGLPVVWQMAKPGTRSLWVGAACGFLAMAGLAYFQQYAGGTGGSEHTGWVMMLVAGGAGASAMILPGVSGGYLLLVLGVYVPILGAISDCKSAIGSSDWAALGEPALDVVLPLSIGVVIGIVGVSLILKMLLSLAPKPTLGVLLGLLVGAVIGLFPFQEGIKPIPTSTFRGQVFVIDEANGNQVMIETNADLEPFMLKGQHLRLEADGSLTLLESGKPLKAEDYPLDFFRPSTTQVCSTSHLFQLARVSARSSALRP